MACKRNVDNKMGSASSKCKTFSQNRLDNAVGQTRISKVYSSEFTEKGYRELCPYDKSLLEKVEVRYIQNLKIHNVFIYVPKQEIFRRKLEGLKGGIVIGLGSTAFVIDPPIECNGITEGVSKVFLSRGHYRETDSALLNILNRIDRSQKRFVFASTPICLKKFSQLSDENKADVLKGMDSIESNEEIQFFNMLTKTQKTERLNNKDYLIESLELLHSNGIAHGDLHKENIVTKDGMPRIIDFGSYILHPTDEEKQKDIENLDKIFSEAPSPPTKRRKPAARATSPKASSPRASRNPRASSPKSDLDPPLIKRLGF